MDAVTISFTTKEGIHVVAWGSIKDGVFEGNTSVWDLKDERDDDFCKEAKYTKSEIDVHNKSDERVNKLNEIIFKRLFDDLGYFNYELTKVGLNLPEHTFEPCEDCAEEKCCSSNFKHGGLHKDKLRSQPKSD